MQIQSLQERKNLCNSFIASVFSTPWYLQNAHYQTIIGSGALSTKLFGQPLRPFVTITEEINTPDGDHILLEFSDNIESISSVGIVIIVHGLESSSRSGLCTNLAISSLEKGFGFCLFNFRGCGIENK